MPKKVSPSDKARGNAKPASRDSQALQQWKSENPGYAKKQPVRSQVVKKQKSPVRRR